MSYCRFSSDNWKCEVYCYESSSGFVTWVASNKVVGEVPLLDWSLMDDIHDSDATTLFMVQYNAQMEWLRTAERRPIGLAHDGKSFDDPDRESFLKTLLMLKEAGYNVPQYVIDEVSEEIAQPPKGG